MSERYGPRHTPGGYQAPSTHSTQITRGRALKEQAWVIGSTRITLKLVPLEGGRPELYEVELITNDVLAGHSDYVPCMVRGADNAQQAFALTAGELDQGFIPANDSGPIVRLPPEYRGGW